MSGCDETQELAAAGPDPSATHVQQQWKYAAPFISGRFHPGGKYAFAGTQDNSVQRVDLATGHWTPFAAHDSWVRAIGFAEQGQTLLTGGFDGRLMWWPALADQPQPARVIQAHDGWLRALQLSPDGQLVATCGDDRKIKLWRVDDGTLQAEWSGHEKNIYSVLFDAAGQYLYSGDLAGVVQQWEVASGKPLQRFDAQQLHTYNGGQRVDFGGVRSLAISPDGQRLACSGLHKATNPLGSVHEPLVIEFNIASQEIVRQHVADGLKGGVWRVVYHPDGFLAGATSGTSGGWLLYWKPDEEKDFHRFKFPHVARDLDLHPDGQRWLTPHFDNHLRVALMAEEA